MVFITAGMGGGTGTGAAPVIARAAREQGILTVGVVTKPFHFEGAHRMRLAESGINELQQFVDTLIIIPNQNLFRIANEKTTFADAFKMADDVLHSGVRGVTDLMVMPGLINLDFADIRSVMTEMGKAMMGTGEAAGERRAIDAAEAAISNPLLDDVSMKGARGVLINITGGLDMTLFEVDEAANRIRDEVDPDANIIFGSTFDQELDGRMRVSVVATGIEAEKTRPAALCHHELHLERGRRRPQDHVARPGSRRSVGAGPSADRLPPHPGRLAPASGCRSGPCPFRLHHPRPHPPAIRPGPPGSGPHHGRQHGADFRRTAAAPCRAGSGQLCSPRAGRSAGTGGQSPSRYSIRGSIQANWPLPSVPVSRSASPARYAAENQDGAFIAPRPADGGPRQQGPSLNAERFVAPTAAVPEPAPKKRGSSLFERVTGIGRRIMEGGEPEQQARQAPQPQAQQPAPARQAPAGAPQQQRPAEQLDRPAKMSHAEEEMLDIPAFLRRQAN